MANPFTLEHPTSGAGTVEPGDVRAVVAKDKNGTIVKTLTIHRTERPYAYDLCDAYNEAISPAARERGLAYYVTDSGEVKLGDSVQFSRWNTEAIDHRHERERRQWQPK